MFLLVTLTACSDYVLHTPDGTRDPLGGLDTADVPRIAVPDLWHLCDGYEVEVSQEIAVDESCQHEPVLGELDAVVEWQVGTFGNYPEFSDIVMAPVVGQLDDDDGDGDIDRWDTPDIVVIADDGAHTTGNRQTGVLRVIRGDGKEGWSYQVLTSGEAQIYPYRYSNVALGDIDQDGQPEIVFTGTISGVAIPPDTGDSAPPDSDTASGGGESGPPTDDSEVPIDIGPPLDEEGVICGVIAVDGSNGEVEWVQQEHGIRCGGHAPAIADLDGNGQVEVVVGSLILKGRTGALVAQGQGGEARGTDYPEMGSHTAVADLDMDGVMEVIAGNTLYDPTGAVICQTGTDDGYPAPADLDMDGVGEFALVGNGWLRIFEHDCSLVMERALSGGGHGGPPTVADFDVDGRPEIGVAEAETYTVYEPDGTVLWSQEVTDASSHATGSVVYDFEGDGRPEVVYADEVSLWVFAGVDGTVRLQDDLHESRTLHEFPTVADIDGDGAIEILVPNAGTHYGELGLAGLYALGSAEGRWLGNRQVWNQHGYAIVNIEDDLGLPSPQPSNWPTYNTFRSGDPNPNGLGASPDAVPLADTCDLECPVDQAVVAVRVGNAGLAPMARWVPVSLYAVDGELRTHLETQYTKTTVDSAEASGTLLFRVDPALVPGGVVEVVVDQDTGGSQVVRECQENNNRYQIELPCRE